MESLLQSSLADLQETASRTRPPRSSPTLQNSRPSFSGYDFQFWNVEMFTYHKQHVIDQELDATTSSQLHTP